VKKIRGDNEIEATLQRLDRLTLDEVRATAAQTLEVVYGLVRHRRVLMDGEKPYCSVLRSLLSFHTSRRGRERIGSKYVGCARYVPCWLAIKGEYNV
jgi:hypothetical protein